MHDQKGCNLGLSFSTLKIVQVHKDVYDGAW